MVNVIKIEYDEEKTDILNKYAFASVELGEWVYVWVGDLERKDLADKIASGEMDLAEAMHVLESLYPNALKVWIRADDEEADATLYLLMPAFFATYGYKQLYIGAVCKNCDCPIGEAAICNSKEPWNCAHGEILYCIKCGAEITQLGAIHGGNGAQISQQEYDVIKNVEARD